ncbi:FG-GAP-like repeat-containing protein [Streptomyces sp. NPDC047117]|uniref:FG-GAP-like repeat-containing protein n=1 Tax=Streptomyces sp. NPDC047117 TaxID=3155379 RepID=UPI0033D0BCA3
MPKHLRTALAAATAAALAGGLLTLTAGPAAAAGSGLQGDFNGDGYRDLAVSAPGATVAGHKDAGAVTILYGSATGVSAGRHATFTQDTTGVQGAAETGDMFGLATSAGDFNSDGYADLAVSAPYEDVSGDADGGTVQILWGAAGGITRTATVPDPAPTKHDRFGNALAAGDFDGDKKSDLAVGTTSATLRVLKGGFSTAGVPAAKAAVKLPILGRSDAGIRTLTAGLVNGDGRTDLVVNGFQETPQGDNHYDANYYLPGSGSGPSTSGMRKLPAGIITAIGDTDGDGYGDLVTGVHWDDSVPGSTKGGKVNVIYGSASGPTSRMDTITQETGAVPGNSERGDVFGYEVSLGDIDGDGRQDLAIGAGGEDIDGVADTGAVTVLRGSPSGIDTAHGVQYFHQDTPGVPGASEKTDFFGGEVFLSDIDGDSKADLTVGASYENDGNGSVVSLLSDGSRIGTAGARSVAPSAVGVPTTGQPQFGSFVTG